MRYIDDAFSLRKSNSETEIFDNIQFHRKNELRIKCPESWNVKTGLIEAIKEKKIPFSKVSIVYSNTFCYRKFYELNDFNESSLIGFISYYELHSAIINSPQDIRQQQRLSETINSSSIVIVLDAENCPPIVLNAIRQFTDNILILID
jgi:hypothetical protein